jgi:hypothetical protein
MCSSLCDLGLRQLVLLFWHGAQTKEGRKREIRQGRFLIPSLSMIALSCVWQCAYDTGARVMLSAFELYCLAATWCIVLISETRSRVPEVNTPGRACDINRQTGLRRSTISKMLIDTWLFCFIFCLQAPRSLKRLLHDGGCYTFTVHCDPPQHCHHP